MHLTVLGEGPELEPLRARARQRGLDERVHFVGFQANPYAFFARADALVLSSAYEGLPNVVLEALACGTPIVALPSPGGLREIVDGVQGCELAIDMSAAALARALERWRPLRIPRSVVARYELTAIVARYAEVLAAGSCDADVMRSE
jgi:glycosyltransferase involved in cell wall biosynthesis